MGKAQKKTGKGRLDKYYKLAKEQGYRARSAFKLIQLNKKYNVLESARCCIDLCAAPGGWLQVASKYMPVNSIIVGVDLVPIKPIPRVSTFAADITTPTCRNLIRSELKDWKADVVLHDGAPNVGTAWVQDAYSQSELVLMSLKLAVEFLIKGGTFVTKVFRSADYNSLIWIFNQLFGRVEATKPPSSRNVSAEIFVVCREFLAPKYIDPKFLDPKHAFKELSASVVNADKENISAHAHANVFMPEKKRRQREGYAEGDYTLHRTSSASEFIRCPDPVAFLGSINRIAFQSEEDKEWTKLAITTSDILSNCEDLKVLGKSDFKALIKWRKSLREELGLDVKTIPTEELTEKVEIVDDVDQEQAIGEELERLNTEAAARTKRERRKTNEARARTIQRMQLQMTAPLDIGLEQSDANLGLGQDDVFDLQDTEKRIRKGRLVSRLVGQMDDEHGRNDSQPEQNVKESDAEDDEEGRIAGLEADLDDLYDAYKDRLNERDAKAKAREDRKGKEKEEWRGFRVIEEQDGGEDDSNSEASEGERGWNAMERAKLEGGESSSSDDDSDSDAESVREITVKTKKRQLGVVSEPPAKKTKLVSSKPNGSSTGRSAQIWFDQDIFKGVNIDDIEGDEQESEPESASDEENVDEVCSTENGDDFEVVPQDNDDDVEMWDVDGANEDKLREEMMLKHGLTTAEAVTLAQQLVNREKTKSQLIDDGFNRYSLNSKEDLPAWFLDDETKHYKSNLPVTKEAVEILRARQRALNARPIKKVAEAKARKKFKAMQKLQKAMKNAEGVNESTDMSEREKAQQIQKLMLKGLAKATQKKSEVKVVVAKSAHKGLKGRPKGVKGRYRMVDARGKKELRAKKRREKANKKKR
ncbi:SPB1 [Sanghuangporus sanghuang]